MTASSGHVADAGFQFRRHGIEIESATQCIVDTCTNGHQIRAQFDRTGDLYRAHLRCKPPADSKIRVLDAIELLASNEKVGDTVRPAAVSTIESEFVIETFGEGVSDSDEASKRLPMIHGLCIS